MTTEQKPNRAPPIFYCLKYPHEALTAILLKVGAELSEGPGVCLGREEDKKFARQHSIPGLTKELVARRK